MNHHVQTFTNPIEAYYRVHSNIYDLTRWSFLFGRKRIVQDLSRFRLPTRILEVGCGTGKNLAQLGRAYPHVDLTGVDLSEAMLAIARKQIAAFNDRVTLLSQPYNSPVTTSRKFDVILFSYSLSMFNPGWSEAIDYAFEDLVPGGLIVVIDFHESAFPGFKRWMQLNHVRLDGHLLPKLQQRFQTEEIVIRKAYAGMWEYLSFVGKRF